MMMFGDLYGKLLGNKKYFFFLLQLFSKKKKKKFDTDFIFKQLKKNFSSLAKKFTITKLHFCHTETAIKIVHIINGQNDNVQNLHV